MKAITLSALIFLASTLLSLPVQAQVVFSDTQRVELRHRTERFNTMADQDVGVTKSEVDSIFGVSGKQTSYDAGGKFTTYEWIDEKNQSITATFNSKGKLVRWESSGF